MCAYMFKPQTVSKVLFCINLTTPLVVTMSLEPPQLRLHSQLTPQRLRVAPHANSTAPVEHVFNNHPLSDNVTLTVLPYCPTFSQAIHTLVSTLESLHTFEFQSSSSLVQLKLLYNKLLPKLNPQTLCINM